MFKTNVLLALMLAPASAMLTHFTNSTEAQKYGFDQFKNDFGKTYDSPEEDAMRLAAFVANLKVIDSRNAAEVALGGKAIHGITQFADLTTQEFKMRYLTSEPAAPKPVTATHVKPLAEGTAVVQDWRGVYTTPVKNQGYCGSCWAFSATEQIESDYWIAQGTEVILSPQQITSCDKTSFGCNGGLTERAYEYVERAGGIEPEAAYPYTSGTAGVTGSCAAEKSDMTVTITGYETVSSSASGEAAMATYVGATGPLSICVDAEQWSSYTGGVMKVCGQSVDHCVQAVGIDTSSTSASPSPYWIVRNSWGVTWGEAGYIYLEYGKNTCNLASDATYVTGAAPI